MRDEKMTWEETIKYIRTQPQYKELVEKAYFEEKLPLNIERFRKSNEFKSTLQFIEQYQPNAKTILDIGSGNGVSAICFALEGYTVTSIEPDPSETIGAGAIRKLKKIYKLENIEIHEAFAEEIKFDTGFFDVVFARQCMHHAYNLQSFVEEAARVLKKTGLFFTVRDHVVYNEKDKKWFLESHPLQKYYGGENAFTSIEYKEAIKLSGLNLVKELRYYESEINYYPETTESIDLRKSNILKRFNVSFLISFFPKFKNILLNIIFREKEKQIPGRMYSYIAIKK